MAEEQDYSDLMGQIKNIRRMQKERALDLATKIPARGMYRAAGYTPAQLEAFAPMPGKFLPADAAAYNKDILAAFNALTEASANPDADSEERMKQRVNFLKAALKEGVTVMNKRAQLGTDVEKARLSAQIKRTEATIDALDTAEGVSGSGSGRSGKSEQEKGQQAAESVLARIKPGDAISTPVVLAASKALYTDEAMESFKKNLDQVYKLSYGQQDSPFDMPGAPNMADLRDAIDDRTEEKRAQGLMRGEGSLSPGEADEVDQAYLDERFHGGGLEARDNQITMLQQEIDNINAHTGGALDAQLQEVAKGASNGRTTDIFEAADMIVGKDMSPEEKAAFQKSVGSEKAALLDKMLDPGAEGPIKQAKLALMQDPNFQKFKKDMGIQTDEFGLRALRKKYRTQNIAARRSDRAQMKRLSEMGTAAQPVRTSAIETVEDTIEDRPTPKTDSANIASSTLDKRDVTVKTKSTGGTDGY